LRRVRRDCSEANIFAVMSPAQKGSYKNGRNGRGRPDAPDEGRDDGQLQFSRRSTNPARRVVHAWCRWVQSHAMTLEQTITAAEIFLPGHPAPEGMPDARWQAISAIGEFIEENPEPVWSFVVRWGSSSDADLRMALATCLLEHLLELHFDHFISRVEQAALADPLFGEMTASCWKFGQSEDPHRAARLDRLLRALRERTR
jgi:uncharacterized protein DUF6869